MMPNVRVLPPTTGPQALTSISISGRSYSPTASAFVDTIDADADHLEGNGWTRIGLVGPTTARPVSLGNPQVLRGTKFVDTSISTFVVHDGISWRNPVTGAAV